MPPRQSTAASGTLPTEQTKLTMATSGPDQRSFDLGQRGVVGQEERLPEALGHPGGQRAGDQEAERRRRSRREAQSITKRWLTAVKPRPLKSRGKNEPPPSTLMSIAAWPSMRPSAPRSACSRAMLHEPRRERQAEDQRDEDRPSGCRPGTRRRRRASPAARSG